MNLTIQLNLKTLFVQKKMTRVEDKDTYFKDTIEPEELFAQEELTSIEGIDAATRNKADLSTFLFRKS